MSPDADGGDSNHQKTESNCLRILLVVLSLPPIVAENGKQYIMRLIINYTLSLSVIESLPDFYCLCLFAFALSLSFYSSIHFRESTHLITK